MKGKIVFVVLLALSDFCFGQDKIRITYDDNGNRILRQLVCQGCKPTGDDAQGNTDKALADKTDNAKNALASSYQVRVHPNPSADNFNLSVDAALLKDNCEFTLSDIYGRVLLKTKITKPMTTISTSGMANGTYYLIVNMGDKKEVIKLVREGA